jgi:putative MFS transporter
LARIDRLPPSRHLLGLVARIASGGWFEFYEMYMPGFISVGLVKSNIYTMNRGSILDLHLFGSFLASFFFGMWVAVMGFSFISDRLGRRTIFIKTMIGYSISQLSIAFLSNPAAIDFARFVCGLMVGMQLINNDSYIAELTPRSMRGRYMTIAYVFALTAIPFTAFLAAILVPLTPFGIDGWRIVVAIGATGGIAIFLLQRGLPESPRWLEAHGRFAEADAIVSDIEAHVIAQRGKALPEPSVNLPEPPKVVTGRWTEMFSHFYLPRTIVISVFQFCQTIAVYGFHAFVPILLLKQGFTIIHSLYYTAIMVLMAPVGGACGSYFSERIERKWQLAGSAAGIGVAGIWFANAHSPLAVLISGALIAFSENWMLVTFHPYAAELFPTRIRARAIGFTFSWSRISAICIGYWVAALLANFGSRGVFGLIAVAMLAIVVAVGGFGPKTNGRSLEVLSP